MYIYYNIYYNF